MSNKRLKEFWVSFKVDIDTSISIKADSLEDAIVKAKELRTIDVVDIPGEHLDSSIRVTGAYE